LAAAEIEDIPLLIADNAQAYFEATGGAGLSCYQEGVATTRILIAYLNGEMDIAITMCPPINVI
jgi:hypothetical protein